MSPEPYVDIQAAADFLDVPKSWLYEQCRLGKVPSAKIGKYRRFRLSELEAWVNRPGDPLVTHQGAASNQR